LNGGEFNGSLLFASGDFRSRGRMLRRGIRCVEHVFADVGMSIQTSSDPMISPSLWEGRAERGEGRYLVIFESSDSTRRLPSPDANRVRPSQWKVKHDVSVRPVYDVSSWHSDRLGLIVSRRMHLIFRSRSGALPCQNSVIASTPAQLPRHQF